MPNFPRTDLAVEAEAIHRSAAAVTELPGVRAEETERRGFAVTEVHVLDVAGENTLCKPIGDYYTLALDPLLRREDDAFENAAQTLAELLRGVLPLMPDASVLVVGLGNRAITPDAVGPDAIDSVMVTRHLRAQLPEHFGRFRSVAALAAGVLGTTGVESADMIRALAGHLHPDAIIIGMLMTLVPGIVFTNAMRDFMAGDCIAGMIKLTEAILIGAGIAVGVSVSLAVLRPLLGVAA